MRPDVGTAGLTGHQICVICHTATRHDELLPPVYQLGIAVIGGLG
ncbi:hypothetical protein BZL30_5040 [Mycobacterium kansasii]|uniref:Uncharacterized protein n=1 Tax=Mycobacterium kansasii TaxID=1768 RepID=A0A1V3X486_MYCKA|nr:hypothetical protein MKSMC1_31340 [Mycobacterium kansasii]OOK74074.1 hypothetical protein BZL30_5040 [Mycobacterium kansasii]OOK77029.1 hypothetical protein BZL29_3751 [Mycobacterium kansasii]